MAPRKPASPAKPRRVTRARAANADTDTKPALDDAPKRKAAISKAVPTTSRTKSIEAKTRVTKKTDTTTSKTGVRSLKSMPVVEVDDNKEDDEITVTIAQPASKTTRATRATIASSAKPVTATLAAAPRRPIRVTPLDTKASEPVATKEAETKPAKKTSAKGKKEETDVSKPTTSRAKRGLVAATVEENNKSEEVVADEPEPKRRGRSRTTSAEANEAATGPSSTAAKGRGRPKKAATTAESANDAPVVTRQTRARTGSSASAALPEATVNVIISPRKKVTFQDLPDEDDEKENKQPPALSKSKTAKKGAATATTTKSETVAKGMRAKPIRKPAATKATKSTRNASKTAKEPEVEEPQKLMPRVLTPKKITQVAKAMPIDSEDEQEHDEKRTDDKSPIHSLSQSPKRPQALPLSPVKTLDFAPALNSPEKQECAPGIMSPPRRLPSSPIKDHGLQESPRRAPEGVTVFRAHIPDANYASLALNPSNTNSNAQLLQSPKRGICDAITFPASAVKSRNSPQKSALLASPARRLFSPSKQKSPARMSPSRQNKQTTPSEEQITSPGDVDIVMSSHFRSSPSPKRMGRVYTMSEDELAQEHGLGGGLDFDQSVLNVRSPLKVDKTKPLMDVSADEMDVEIPGQDEGSEQQDNTLIETVERGHVDDAVPAPASEVDGDATILDPALEKEDELEGSDDHVDVDNLKTHDAPQAVTYEVPTTSDEASMKPPRMSGAMFRRLREVDEDSEDEIAADSTPDNRLLRPQSRPSLSAANIRSRLSMGTGIVPQSASRNLGFTPLAAQVRGWRAGSPEKRVARGDTAGLFSPLARMHVEGGVEVNRQSTPAREALKRKSLAGRLSFAPSTTESPIRPDFFGEAVAAQEFEDQMNDHVDEGRTEDEDLHNLVQHQALEVEDAGQDEQSDEDTKSSSPEREPGELTTDLIKFTNASDTAMVDFNALASEAEVLAVEKGVEEEAEIVKPQDAGIGASELPVVDEEQSVQSTSSDSYVDENAAPVEQPPAAIETEVTAHEDVEDDGLIQPAPVDSDTEDEVEEEHDADLVNHQAEPAESLEANLSNNVVVSPATSAGVRSSVEMDFNVTPVRPDLGLPRVVHTVSKVPLRPEGDVPTFSPVKMQRKRPRSMSSSNSMASKRRSLGLSPKVVVSTGYILTTPRGGHLSSSPQRRIRSAAPSPADSLATGMTTPGQMSFAIEDFGDSTLDGLEVPDDELLSDEVDSEESTEKINVDESVMTIGSALFKTPIVPSKRTSMAPPSTGVSKHSAAPHYAMSTRSSRRRSLATPSRAAAATSTKTPATAAKTTTPHTALKPAKDPVSRTPLKSVGSGILSGATIHYDIHTSEGSDASAFYVELLTAMGARCVKEWRWNPRASIATEEAPVGITHVVYKDGGKRTLEKVRSAKGQVLCVGVNWVLDCYREQKWVDETSHAVDASILPRGGSRRRKSMEPRTLVNENGLLSATKRRERMSLPASLSRGESAPADSGLQVEVEVEVEDKENVGDAEVDDMPGDDMDYDNDVSMTSVYDGQYGDELEDSYEYEAESNYDSPAAATVGDAGETIGNGLRFLAGQGRDQNDSGLETTTMTPLPPVNARYQLGSVSTPQSAILQVDYDPRTAATPVTPFVRVTTANKKVALGKGQMSAPAKQVKRSLFEQDADAEDESVREARPKFQIKSKRGRQTGKGDARRKTLGA
ncbi:hypothetical protein LTS07_009775 [Exophiala sideris]|uniref:BRCT domain-containing protein n=1 Tax=Exophiala sideris TaxID=1016849 RepID=A0ABR0J9N0_9EURO|nr:hypothetical protein LTS07_009775 [Exophiala sideris]KAK5026699.1 hypothetical protein LTR13_009923 [Exophiala sideris]KAK5059424.1 hypothetical protein LTR69_006013 [Exophiala sideris]KAK5177432.1 hypothetical protein LTR44_010047 [Eurotiomycetes sp. CCFEE 6388]